MRTSKTRTSKTRTSKTRTSKPRTSKTRTSKKIILKLMQTAKIIFVTTFLFSILFSVASFPSRKVSVQELSS